MDNEAKEDQTEIWHPPRGIKSKIIAWLLLFVVAAGCFLMIFAAINALGTLR